MAMCQHEIRETRRGAGPCRIEAEVKLRNGKPNWWCRTHGLAASGPDGTALSECSGAWFDPVPDEACLELDAGVGEIAIWGALDPGIMIGEVEPETGKVHVHRRLTPGSLKDIDRSFDIVTVRNGEEELVIEGMAAVAFSISELAGREVTPLQCPHCGETHIDEKKFATFPHSKHLCNSCGRNFRDRNPSISNPLADANKQLGLPPPAPSARPNRPLSIDSAAYRGIALYPSNEALLSTMTRAEEDGIHVHAWNTAGEMVIDETYSTVDIDGDTIDEDLLRILTVQRSLAHGAPIIAMDCGACGSPLCDSLDTYLEPTTNHICSTCGHESRTRRKSFVNPLARRFC